MNVKSTFSIAATAALFALSAAPMATAIAADKPELVHCYDVNTCKGTSDCKSYGHECKGQNECKGQGFKEMTEAACTEAGGHLTEMKK
jgi:uncharacterized membrane protein